MRYYAVYMGEPKKHILVAVAWPYANGSLHLGHIAAFIGGDVLARYHRMKGDAVLMVSGSDCYGTPIAVEAIRRGVDPASIADRYHKEFKKTLIEDLGFTYDLYTKTTTPEHAKTVQGLFLDLHRKGHLYIKADKGLYSPFLNRFLPDRFVEGTCPHCGYSSARGDQCDECSTLLDPLTLIEPAANPNIFDRSVSSADRALEVRESEHFYLRLSAFQDTLDQWVGRVSGAWRVNAAQFTKSFLKQGLLDRAVTRDTDWGIPVPLEGYEGKRLYVWFDAVLGYLSASQQASPDAWRAWWCDDDAVHYYVHGKDNVPFHTLILPAILTGSGGYHLPDRVFASEYLSLEGKQFSTSRLHAVWVPEFLECFDAELLRYILTAHGPETADIDFRWTEFGQLVNGELIGTFGNLVNRICTFAEKRFPDGAALPEATDIAAERLLTDAEMVFDTVGLCIENGQFRQAFREIMRLAEHGNRFAHAQEPWKRISVDPVGAEADVAVLLQTIYSLALVVRPFLPRTSEQICSFFSDGAAAESWGYRPLPGRIVVGNIRPLFSKIEEADIRVQREKLGLG